MERIYFVLARQTLHGHFKSALSSVTDLASAISAETTVVEQANLAASHIDKVLVVHLPTSYYLSGS